MIGPISPEVKQMGARSAGNPHAACDVEGAGNVARSGYLGQLARQSSTLPGKPRDGFVLGEPLRRHQKCLILRNASRIAQSSEDLAKISVCGMLTEFRGMVSETEAVNHPFFSCVDERVVEIGEGGSGKTVGLVQDQLEGAGHEHSIAVPEKSKLAWLACRWRGSSSGPAATG